MSVAEQADAATTRDALAAAARLMVLCGDLRGLQPDLTPEPTPSAERRTQPQETK